MPRKEIHITGTHCQSCEVVLERRLRKVPGVNRATVDFRTGRAVIDSERTLSSKELASVINKDGYRLDKATSTTRAPATKDYLSIAGLFILFIALYVIAKRLDILPSVGVSEGMSLGFVLIIGLIASTSTCLAVTGGLLLALSAKHAESSPGLDRAARLKPAIYFSLGRVVGYVAFGAALGALGSLLTVTPFASGIITVVAAVVMIVLGVQLLQLFPALSTVKIRMPKFIAHAVFDRSGKAYRPWAPFVLGAGTFFVPCGFTQALQFYVLASGNALSGALTMGVFALGTVPMLFALGAASTLTRGPLHTWFIRVAAVLVVLLGLLSLPAGIALLQ